MTKILLQKPPDLDMDLFLETVIKAKCDGVQLYVTNQSTKSFEQWISVKQIIDDHSLFTIVHLSNPFSIQDLRIARYLAGDLGIFVIHYNLKGEAHPSAWGVLGLENANFGVDQEYDDQWLQEASKVGRIPVFDIPRLFKNTSEDVASNEMKRIMEKIEHYVLHLIDFSDNRQERSDFIPMGQGILSPILEELPWSQKPVAVILEFEQIEQSLDSLPFLRKLFHQQ